MTSRYLPQLFVTLILVLAACSKAETPIETSSPAPVTANTQKAIAEQQRPIVVMLGDSLTAGYGLPQDKALPEQINERLRLQSIEASIINAGVSGDTTRAGLARYDWSVKSANADILLIALGANDFLSGYPPNVAEDNLAKIIEMAQSDAIKVALIGLKAKANSRPLNWEDEYADIFANLSKKYGVPLYDDLLGPLGTDSTLLQPDGLHPTQTGVASIAKGLEPFVIEQISAWRSEQTE